MIYGSIDGDHPALAKLHRGEDILFPGEQRYITSSNLRGSVIEEKVEEVFLHRLLLKTRGRPLWEFSSEKELLQGIGAALRAHEFLCAQGILHRDISPGNIMLSVETTPEVGEEGFLMDLEFAHLEQSSLNTRMMAIHPLYVPSVGMTSPAKKSDTVSEQDVMRAAMTGTAQFMAAEILEAILTAEHIEHHPRHDIESFIYVLAYALTRRAVLESHSLDESTRTRRHLFFYSTFGRMRLDEIWISRRGQMPLTLCLRFPNVLSPPMSELLKNLDVWLMQSRLPSEWNPKPLTHGYVLSQLDNAIAKLV